MQANTPNRAHPLKCVCTHNSTGAHQENHRGTKSALFRFLSTTIFFVSLFQCRFLGYRAEYYLKRASKYHRSRRRRSSIFFCSKSYIVHSTTSLPLFFIYNYNRCNNNSGMPCGSLFPTRLPVVAFALPLQAVALCTLPSPLSLFALDVDVTLWFTMSTPHLQSPLPIRPHLHPHTCCRQTLAHCYSRTQHQQTYHLNDAPLLTSLHRPLLPSPLSHRSVFAAVV